MDASHMQQHMRGQDRDVRLPMESELESELQGRTHEVYACVERGKTEGIRQRACQWPHYHNQNRRHKFNC
eukprot:354232-Chlamydomonas_euryale.AAC.7